ncbi:Inhibitor of growth protein 3 [Hondaea fermentalgiana]|uniref:Inhibitor of growth protein 3 n=1 Tax=Hondaea fermentalgiana TaxID=2315210 RepID=A0A2R5GGC4_9STRA|nr:Inhibitor of growth protein 3 [Hondaea fermentalgiana]|eukprot:GBG29645.1 Inhibitor of growth protein 3 [Hondaea fermentalgiana]
MKGLAVVVGASRGVGLGLAKRLAKEDYRVIGTCRSVPEELQGDAAPFQVVKDVDVAEDACVDTLRQGLAGEDHIDLLVFNAGIGEPEWGVDRVANVKLDVAARQMNVNAFGAVRTLQALGDKLGKGSKVLLVTSRVGSVADNGSGGNHGYRMSKAALNILGMNLSHEFGPKGVIVTLVHPGLVSTSMTGFTSSGISVDESVDGFMQRIDNLSSKDQGSFLHALLRHSNKRKKEVQLLPRELDRYPRSVRADFRACEYAKRYSLDVRDGSSTTELASIVGRHYASHLDVAEDEVIHRFVKYTHNYQEEMNQKRIRREKEARRRGARSTFGGRQYESDTESTEQPKLYCVCNRPSFGEMIGCDDDDCKIEWFHVGCVDVTPDALSTGAKWYCPSCRAKRADERAAEMAKARAKQRKELEVEPVKHLVRPSSASSSTTSGAASVTQDADTISPTGSAKGGITYAAMIGFALEGLDGQTGTFRAICDRIEERFADNLNWKPESENRRTPVWKSSVRKILISHNRFRRIEPAEPGQAHVFAFR